MQLVLHADDLGLNRAVSDGILRGFAYGLLTSTSVLANAPDAPHAIAQWKQLLHDAETGAIPAASLRRSLGDPPGRFDLGVHLNLTQGRPLTAGRYPRELLDESGRFPGVFSLFRRLRCQGARVRAALKEELSRQVQVVLDHGLQPTHLNGHQYVEMIPPVDEIIPELLSTFQIKVVRVALERPLFASALRGGISLPQWLLARVKQSYARRFGHRMDQLGVVHPDAFFGTMHAGRIDMRVLRLFLRRPARWHVVEIALHPGEEPAGNEPKAQSDGWDDPLSGRRPKELKMLLSAELPQFLASQKVQLGRLNDLAAAEHLTPTSDLAAA